MLAIIMAIADENDRRFVQDLYDQYSGKMISIAEKILHNEADAEDCVHDVVRVIIDDLERFRSADLDGLKRLLTVCIRNMAINRYNQNRRRGAATLNAATDAENAPIELNILDIESDVARIVVNEEMAVYVHELVNQLEPKYRDVIVLKYFYSMNNQEIARTLDISESLVRMQVTRGKRKLMELGGKTLYEYREA